MAQGHVHQNSTHLLPKRVVTIFQTMAFPLKIAVALGVFATVCEALTCLRYSCSSCDEGSCQYASSCVDAGECFASTLTYDGRCQWAAGGCIPTDSTCDAILETSLADAIVDYGSSAEVSCSACDTDNCNAPNLASGAEGGGSISSAAFFVPLVALTSFGQL
uniref:Uncharacterized protein n=1 Tax=Noctiluca scintillans TaxID=2966 RepID=A0A7S1A9R8_NOCSC